MRATLVGDTGDLLRKFWHNFAVPGISTVSHHHSHVGPIDKAQPITCWWWSA
jgi:hypothetical protein